MTEISQKPCTTKINYFTNFRGGFHQNGWKAMDYCICWSKTGLRSSVDKDLDLYIYRGAVSLLYVSSANSQCAKFSGSISLLRVNVFPLRCDVMMVEYSESRWQTNNTSETIFRNNWTTQFNSEQHNSIRWDTIQFSGTQRDNAQGPTGWETNCAILNLCCLRNQLVDLLDCGLHTHTNKNHMQPLDLPTKTKNYCSGNGGDTSQMRWCCIDVVCYFVVI